MDLILAFSLQDQVEKYGAYVGLAAFIGLAVLSLLYFAQARELKRLREWAGRAPERAQELQARVVAQAEEALSAPEVEPAVERSGAVGPAQPVAQPAAAPATGNGRQTGTPAPIPMGPRPAVAMAAAAARAAAAPATVTEEPPAEEAGTAVVPTGDDGAAPSSDESAAAAPAGGDRAGAGDEAPVGQPTEEAAAVEPAGEAGPAEEDRPAEPARSGNGVPAKPPADLPPTSIPRATPRPQPKPEPHPVPAAPLRASTTRSATLSPPRRSARRPQRDGSSRTGLYTLVGIVVLAVAIIVPVYFMVLSGEDEAPPPNPIAEPGGTPTSDAGAGERAAAARPEKVVVVLNGTSIDGLASGERDTLIQAGYVDGMIRIDNSDDQSRQDSLVLYAEDERRQARDVARLLDVTRTEQIDEETQALADSSDESGTLPADVVVILGTDKAP
jgi:LytR cell envelope-related transcriptional attenuator